MADGSFGVIIFLVLIVAFVVYIIAAAMRDRKKRLLPDEPPEGARLLQEGEKPAAREEPRFCYSCMEKLAGGEDVCPFCGRPTAAQGKPGHLPAGAVLAERYTVGLAAAESRGVVIYAAADNYLETKHYIREYFPDELAVRGTDGTQVAAMPGSEERFAAGKQQFAREIRLLCRLNGFSSAAGVTDLFYTNGTVYAVTAYAAGQPLPEYLAARGTLSPELTLALFAPVIRQLEAEQSMGLTRCNLAPECFTVCGGTLKIEGIGAPGGRLSTFLKPGFAPEELYRKSGACGAWTDVYSLCAVMYACLTGVVPDAASDRVYKDDLRAPSSLGFYLSAAFEEGLVKGLSVYGEDRFPDCAALGRAIYHSSVRPAGGERFRVPIIDPLTDVPPEGDGLFREPEDNDIRFSGGK